MTKYSIIVPVYNTEKYLDKCFSSLVNQTYKDYEIIVVNDGSTDKSKEIIESYRKKYPKIIKVYNKENSGNVAEPRNFGVERAAGEYILFVDSDDYISEKTLEILDNVNDYCDVLSFSGESVSFDGDHIEDFKSISFERLSGEEALCTLISNVPCFEIACRYAYKTEFFKKNKFKYQRFHEDFGLTSVVIARAKTVKSINDKLYFYRQSGNSITRNGSYKKTVQRVYDMLYHFDFLYNEFSSGSYSKNTQLVLNSYIANAVISKLKDLNKIDKRAYLCELNNRKVKSLLIDDTVLRKLKKLLIYISIDLYLMFK